MRSFEGFLRGDEELEARFEISVANIDTDLIHVRSSGTTDNEAGLRNHFSFPILVALNQVAPHLLPVDIGHLLSGTVYTFKKFRFQTRTHFTFQVLPEKGANITFN